MCCGMFFIQIRIEDMTEWNALESDEVTLYSKEFALSSGAYSVTVIYDSQTDLLNDTNNVSDIAGYVSMDSYQCPAALYAGALSLNDGENSKSQTIWINYGADITDLQIAIQYNGKGSLRVDEISIEECYIYRFTRLFGFLALFVIIDFLYVFFFTSKIAVCDGMKQNVAVLLGILGIASIPLMGNIVYYGHDLDFHINRIASTALALEQGQFPVRMHSEMLNGYGYATPLFYGDLLLYVPAVLYLLKVPLGMCYQLYILLNNILTVAFSYMFFKAVTKEDKYILLGVYIYTLAPYRLINIYTRAAVGEFTAMTFFPLVVLGFWNIYSKAKWSIRDWFPLIIGLSGIIQSHVISTVMVAIFIGLYCVIEWRKTLQIKRMLCLLKTVVMTFLLNAWFLIPMLDSMSMDIMSTSRKVLIQEQGVYPIQWISLFFTAIGKSLKNTTQEEMGFSLGIPICIGIVLALYIYAKRKEYSVHKNYEMVMVCLALGLVAVVFTSRFFPWDILADRSDIVSKYFCMIQYPWRYLAIATILLTVVTIGVFILLENRWKKTTINMLISSIVIFSIISVGYYFQQFIYESPAYSIMSESNRNVMFISNQEYLLQGTQKSELYTKNIEDNVYTEIVEERQENGTYYFLSKNNNNKEEKITFPIINYENYKVYDSNTGNQFVIENGINNCITIHLPAGYEGIIGVEYQEPMIWKACNLLSIISLIILWGMCIWKRKGSK